MPAHSRHWPRTKGGLDCLCGWHAATPELLYEHMRTWFYPLRRVEFKSKTREGYRVAVGTPGHRMIVKPSVVTGRDSIHCACGAVIAIPAILGMEGAARLHVTVAVINRCSGGNEIGLRILQA